MNLYLGHRSVFLVILYNLFSLTVFPNQPESPPVIISIDFNNLDTGSFSMIEAEDFTLTSENGEDRILDKGGRISSPCLYIKGGEDRIVYLTVKNTNRSIRFRSCLMFPGQP